MKTHLYLPLLIAGAAFTLCSCANDPYADNRPAPGTVGATSSKNSMNNTPQVNPNPNPEPASNPPGPQSDRRPVTTY